MTAPDCPCLAGYLALGALTTAVFAAGAAGAVSALSRTSPMPIAAACVPTKDNDCILYPAAYDQRVEPPYDATALIGPVYRWSVDGLELIHTKDGWNLPWWEADYTEQGRFSTPDDYVVVVGCPERTDGEEAMQIVREWQADPWSTDFEGKA